jgi:heme-degrading monooxygenase HmoA
VYVIIWAFRPRPGREPEFEQAYGPGGGWATLFRAAPGYLGTDLLRAADGSGRYLTVDRWQSRAAYEAFRAASPAEYENLDRAGEDLTSSEGRVGDYVLVESLPNSPPQPTGPV